MKASWLEIYDFLTCKIHACFHAIDCDADSKIYIALVGFTFT